MYTEDDQDVQLCSLQCSVYWQKTNNSHGFYEKGSSLNMSRDYYAAIGKNNAGLRIPWQTKDLQNVLLNVRTKVDKIQAMLLFIYE